MSDTPQSLQTRVAELLDAGKHPDAVALCLEQIHRDANSAEVHGLAGIAFARAGDLQSAARHFARAGALEPDRAEFQRNLGFALARLGQYPQATAALAEAIRLDDGDLVALYEMAGLHRLQGRRDLAAECYQRILARDPANVRVLVDHGNVLGELGQASAAEAAYRRALAERPDLTEARFALACTRGQLGHGAEALELYRGIEASTPDYPGLQLNMGYELKQLGRAAEAIVHYDRAIAQKPDDHFAYNNRGNALHNQQRMQEAAESFRRALALKPDYAGAHSNLLLSLNYTEVSQGPIFAESRLFEARHAAPLREWAPHPNVRTVDRRLRVGYVSADFRRHSVAYFIRPVLAAHDPGRFEMFCYANVGAPDEVTGQIRSLAQGWRPISGLTDEEVARQVREDAIDILIDLNGHTAGNRLLAFARKPAPIQVSWLGYPNTTGLSAMDYRITDAVADPPGEADRLHSERLLRLPGPFLCYQPEALPALAAAPAGDVVLGSFNALAKMTPAVVAAWSAILSAIPRSRLVLKAESLDEADTQTRVHRLFAGHGIGPDRLTLLPVIEDHGQHLGAYARIDLALDPFPYNGTTTTLESLWMGVPVVVLRGSRHAARVGASILEHSGLGQWVAGSLAEYISLAADWGRRPDALRQLRPTIRQAMMNSPVSDAGRFTAGLERCLNEAWRTWCEASPPGGSARSPDHRPGQ